MSAPHSGSLYTSSSGSDPPPLLTLPVPPWTVVNDFFPFMFISLPRFVSVPGESVIKCFVSIERSFLPPVSFVGRILCIYPSDPSELV